MAELFHTLGIDWHVLIVQIVNVGILVFILQRFAFKPLLRAIDERRLRIAEDERRSTELTERLAAVDAERERILEEARRQSETLIKEGAADGKALAEKIAAEAREQSAAAAAAGKRALAEERERLVKEVKAEIGTVVADAVEKVVSGAFDAPAEKRIVEETVALIHRVPRPDTKR